ncbi:MAG: BrxA/BrxB family bacilliredoxin [Gemmatimonadales bacterium]
MRYDPRLAQPMREELTRLGFVEMLTPEDVDGVMADKDGTTLVVVNSVCGCAAGKARPGVAVALQADVRPSRLVTVFAGMELEATDRTRSYFPGYPPSSPQIALFKAGELVHMLERHDIEGRAADEIAADLATAFAEHCG